MSFQGSGVAPGSGALVLEERRTGPSLSVETKRIARALALATIYGLPLGARGGVASMLEHAVGVVLGLAAVAGFAAPAFYILIAHTGSRLPVLAVVEAVRRCVGTTALVLAGLTPAAALLVVSTEGAHAAAFYGALGLSVAYGLGLRRLLLDLFDALSSQPSADDSHELAGRVAVLGFVAFALLLSVRVWSGTLPLFGVLS
jgi:hypothetical protein